MRVIKIESADVFLDDRGGGKGKLTISDSFMGAYNYFWGAMGGTLEEFISHINTSYFVNKLCSSSLEFNAKLSARNIRKYIRTELSYELPFWKFMQAQKEMRQMIKELESCENANEFVDACLRLPDALDCCELSYNEEKEFKGIIRGVFTSEPWHFIEESESREAIWLADLHSKIKVELKKAIAV